MRNLAEDGDGRAQTVLKIVENPGKMLSAILIGNNIVNLSASSLATTLAIGIGGNKLVGIATGVLTLLILVCTPHLYRHVGADPGDFYCE